MLVCLEWTAFLCVFKLLKLMYLSGCTKLRNWKHSHSLVLYPLCVCVYRRKEHLFDCYYGWVSVIIVMYVVYWNQFQQFVRFLQKLFYSNVYVILWWGFKFRFAWRLILCTTECLTIKIVSKIPLPNMRHFF